MIKINPQKLYYHLKAKKWFISWVGLGFLFVSFFVPLSTKAQIEFSSVKFLATDNKEASDEIFTPDIDGDGDPDILSNANRVVWFENKGNGNISSKNAITGKMNNPDFYPSDIDNDGDLDVIAIDNTFGNGTLVLWENAGSGVFPGPPRQIDQGPSGDITVNDFNGDNGPDIVLMDKGNNRIVKYINQGGGTFSNLTAIDNFNSNPQDILSSDLDGDNDPDLLIATNNKLVWYENANGNFGTQQVIHNHQHGRRDQGIYATDIGGDGDIDVFRAGKDVAWYENTGNGNFGSAQKISTEKANSIFAKDLNNDSQVDVVVTTDRGVHLKWYENLGGIFSKPDTIALNNLPLNNAIHAKDLNSDNKPDLVGANRGNGSNIYWFQNLGDPCKSYNALTSFKNVTCNGAQNGIAKVDSISEGTAPFIYDWSTNDNLDSIGDLGPGEYTVTVTDANNCKDTDTVNITQPAELSITKNTWPDTNGNGVGRASIEVNGGTPPYQYSWQGQSSSDSFLADLDSGNYVVIVTDSNNCKLKDTLTVGNFSTTGINEPQFPASLSLKVYPQPVNDQLNLESPNSKFTNYNLQTLTGRTLQSGKLRGQEQKTVDVSNLSAGVYLLQVKTDEAVRTKKVVVE